MTELATCTKAAGPAFESRQGRKPRESWHPYERALWEFRWRRGGSGGPGDRHRRQWLGRAGAPRGGDEGRFSGIGRAIGWEMAREGTKSTCAVLAGRRQR